jgi:hypothetical protein
MATAPSAAAQRGVVELRKNIRHSAGTIVIATIKLATIAYVLVHASGENNRSSRPSRKNTGRKLTTVVLTAVTTAGATSFDARSAIACQIVNLIVFPV